MLVVAGVAMVCYSMLCIVCCIPMSLFGVAVQCEVSVVFWFGDRWCLLLM